MRFFLYFFYVITFSFASLVSAAEPDDTPTKALTKSAVTSETLIETLLGLGLVVALILGLAWLIKRTGKFQSSSNGAIKVVAGLSLGTREKAILLEVEGEKILVGVTPNNINTLHILGKTNDTQHQQDKYAQFDQQLQTILAKEDQHD